MDRGLIRRAHECATGAWIRFVLLRTGPQLQAPSPVTVTGFRLRDGCVQMANAESRQSRGAFVRFRVFSMFLSGFYFHETIQTYILSLTQLMWHHCTEYGPFLWLPFYCQCVRFLGCEVFLWNSFACPERLFLAD
jgi:hypothetical protein